MSRRVVALAIATLAGALFGAGLLVSGMTRPDVVISFLDVTRDWNPNLALVIGGAVTVYALTYVWIRRRGGDPWFGDAFHLPTRRDIDVQLVTGAALFGIGWGLAGLCPGPAIVTSVSGGDALAFALAMLAGMYLFARLRTSSSRSS